jgi:type VI secretion system VgrG family protein
MGVSMTYLTSKKFDFRSSALPEDKFGVVHFKGFEGFSTPYEFEIMLVSSDPDIDMTKVLQNPAVFTIVRPDGDILFQGILASFDLLHAVDEHVFYRAVLVPRLWWLSLTQHNQIFLDKTVPEIIGEVLEDGGLTTDDYEFRLQNEWPTWEYVCQYRESHLNFVSRWMEREGMYYFFEQTEKGEKLIITDTNMSHTPMAEGKTMSYSPPSGMEEAHREEVISAIVCKQKLLPAKLHVNDYNYRKPSLSLSAEAEVLDRGRGEVHLYGEHFRTPEEGQELARIRAEELLSHEKRFHGESTIPYLRPGYLFDLEEHFRDSLNQQYLTIELEHEGNQTGFLLAGIQKGLAEVEAQPYYRNSFVAIPSDVQYRHPKTTEKPSFNGTINARIDAEGSGIYAELDGHGRYKVKLPFDASGRNDGHASHWLRMAQPYAGTDHGMHFPLHKGTEVLLTFVEGDPDRPIIAAAVPNPGTSSPVTAENQTQSVIQSAGQNKIHMEDLAGKERILMQSPKAGSWVRIGAPNDPPNPLQVVEGAEIAYYTDSDGTWRLVENNKLVDSKLATASDTSAKYRLNKTFTVKRAGDVYSVTSTSQPVNLTGSPPPDGSSHLIDGNTWTLGQMPTINDGEEKDVSFYRETTVNLDLGGAVVDQDPGNGIRIRSNDNIWLEAENRYANYMAGLPTGPLSGPSDIQYLIDKMYNYDGDFKPTGIMAYDKAWDDDTSAAEEFEEDTDYKIDDIVKYRGHYFKCIQDHKSGIAFVSGKWEKQSKGSPTAKEFGENTNYKVDDIVKYEGLYYKCKQDHKSGTPFDSSMWKQRYELDSSDKTDKGKWQFLVNEGQVKLAKGDTFITQEGNIYDFGGYWVYNLGNCYIENHLNQEAELNAEHEWDMLDAGGPGWNEIKPIKETELHCQGGSKNELKEWKATHKDSNDWKNIWVEKKFGDSYEYTDGNTISVTKGSTHEIKVSAKSIEEKYSSGKKIYYYKSGGGRKTEKKWNRYTGALMFQYQGEETANGYNHTQFELKPTAHVAFTFAPHTHFAVNTGINATADLNVAAKNSLAINMGEEIDIKLNPVTFGLKVQVGASLFGGIKGNLLGDFILNLNNLDFEWNGKGIKAKKKAALEAQLKELEIESMKMGIKTNNMNFEKLSLDLKKEDIKIDIGTYIKM